MSYYVVYYRADAWQQRDGFLVQTVRQPLTDGRILIVDLWKGLDAPQPIILRITSEGHARREGVQSSDFATRLLPQDITLVQMHEHAVGAS